MMANYQYTSDIKAKALSSASEPTNGKSEYESDVLDFINNAYTKLALGGLEYNEHIQEEWWWLRKARPGILILSAPFTTGSVSLTNNSAAGAFSVAPAVSVQGWYLRVDGVNAAFQITSHTAGATSFTLDSPYIGSSAASAKYIVFKSDYDLAADVLRLDSPMNGFMDGKYQIEGMELGEFDREWPMTLFEEGVPTVFTPLPDKKVRFNRYGTTANGGLLRVEYNYLQRPTPLTNTANEEPIVPLEYRYLISHMATFEILFHKDDNRAMTVSEIIKRGIQAMALENRHRMSNYSRHFGKIMPRPNNVLDKVKRTTSGFIIR